MAYQKLAREQRYLVYKLRKWGYEYRRYDGGPRKPEIRRVCSLTG